MAKARAPKLPTTLLAGADEAEYVNRLCAVLSRARLNTQFPNARSLQAHIAAMGPDMLRLAGRIGDGVVLSAGLSTESVKQSLKLCAEGAGKYKVVVLPIKVRHYDIVRFFDEFSQEAYSVFQRAAIFIRTVVEALQNKLDGRAHPVRGVTVDDVEAGALCA